VLYEILLFIVEKELHCSSPKCISSIKIVEDWKIMLFDFNNEELELISHSLYMQNNKLGYTNHIRNEVKELSSSIQRRINFYLSHRNDS